MTIVRYEPWAFVGRLQRQLDRALGEVADSATVSWIPHVDMRDPADGRAVGDLAQGAIELPLQAAHECPGLITNDGHAKNSS